MNIKKMLTKANVGGRYTHQHPTYNSRERRKAI